MTAPSSDDAFAAIAAAVDYPMYVVTCAAGTSVAGCLVGFTTQVSIDPVRFLVGLSRNNRTEKVAATATHLVVHLLQRRRQELAVLFGGETGDEVDKFARCGWAPGPGGAPVLEDVAGWFGARILDRFDCGDHVGVLIEPVGGAVAQLDGEFVTFADVRELQPGHEA